MYVYEYEYECVWCIHGIRIHPIICVYMLCVYMSRFLCLSVCIVHGAAAEASGGQDRQQGEGAAGRHAGHTRESPTREKQTHRSAHSGE